MILSEKGIIIRKTIESDLAQIYSMGQNEPLFTYTPSGWKPDDPADIFAALNSICLSAVRKKKVLGFILGLITGDTSRIQWMMTLEKYRKIGIGSELLESYIQISKKKGSENLLTAFIKNTPESVNFFSARGFALQETFVELGKKF